MPRLAIASLFVIGNSRTIIVGDHMEVVGCAMHEGPLVLHIVERIRSALKLQPNEM